MAASPQTLNVNYANTSLKCAHLYRPCTMRPLHRHRLLLGATTASLASVTPAAAAATNRQCSISQLRQLALAAPSVLPLFLAAAWPAVADEDAAVDAAYAAVTQQSEGSTDLLVSVLAVVVFGLLVVVTAGVAYLALKSWLDENEEKDARSGRKPPAVTSSAPAASSGSSSSDDDDDTQLRKRVRVKREKRGFGGN